MKRLRRNIRLMGMLLIGLFMILGAYFSYSVYFYGGRWFANAYNPRLASQKQQVVAGDIADRTGLTLATTVSGERKYAAAGTTRRAVAHVVGDPTGMVANGAETFMAGYLLGFKQSLLDRVLPLLTGEQRRGADIALTIDASLSTYIAEDFPAGYAGAVALINYDTGEIYALCSFPTFDPLDLAAALADERAGTLVNRATQGLYPPGSTFKVITLAAGLEAIPDLCNRKFHCTGQLPVERSVVTEAKGMAHGTISMLDAFKVSCNNAFAVVALELGYDRMAKTAATFGFNENFLFRDLVLYNSSYPVSHQNRDDLAWSGIGQGRVLVTPLHMAMIAGAVANKGVMMEPRLLYAVRNGRGQQRVMQASRVYRRSLPVDRAQMLCEQMLQTVQDGTGTRAALAGYAVGGKTGTAEVSNDKSIEPHAWYMGFIQDARHPLAIAVLVENGGGGGTVAAPIARRVMERAIALGY